MQTDFLIDKWDARREVQNLMGKYTYCYLLHKEKEMFDRFWSHRVDVCMGVNHGWYQGSDAVRNYFHGLYEKCLANSHLLQKIFPEQLQNWDDDRLYGVGLQDHKPICNQVIEIADDLQTAKGLWHCQGKHDELTVYGPLSYWTWGWFAVDFIRENDSWKIWHLMLLQDIDHPCGYAWGRSMPALPKLKLFSEAESVQLPEPNIPCILYTPYSKCRPYTQPPRLPEPYRTFSDTFSYGI